MFSWAGSRKLIFFFLLSLCGNTCLTSIFTFESFQVMHSQRLSEKPLRPWAIVDTSGTIRSAHCDCMAGLGETCTHVAAMLFAIEYNIRQREKKTVTQEKAYWLVPSVREAPYAEASDIDFDFKQHSHSENIHWYILIDVLQCHNQPQSGSGFSSAFLPLLDHQTSCL